MARPNHPDFLDFDKASLFGGEHNGIDIATAGIVQIANAFYENMNRIASLGRFPIVLSFYLGLYVKAVAIAAKATRIGETERSQPLDSEGPKELVRLLCEYDEELAALTDIQLASQVRQTGTRLINTVMHEMTRINEEAKQSDTWGVQAIMYAMVLNSYAAYETLATDLWVESMNQNPKLASRFADSNSDKGLSLGFMQKYNFDLSRAMGTVLVDQNRASFQSCGDIQKNYVAAFGDDVRAVFDDNPDLLAVSKIRHLLAHKAGLIDDKFAIELKSLPLVPECHVGEYIKIDGELTCRILDVVLKSGADLIAFVDNHLSPNSATAA